MLVLGIETSCDETACAVVEDGKSILSNCISSSVPLHKKFGGIVPEIASRYHLEYIVPALDKCLRKASIMLKEVDLIAVTYGPGLLGSLLVGINLAKSLSFALNKPLMPVNHLKAHLYAAFMDSGRAELPAVGLIVSGGHTEIVFIKEFDSIEIMGTTRDDAAGEAFDKVARILGLGYPGGAVIDRLARRGRKNRIKFRCGRFKGSLDFSFSGIKTAVLYYLRNQKPKTRNQIANICAGFQQAVVDVLVENVRRACYLKKTKQLIIGGGVSANTYLRERINSLEATDSIEAFVPPAVLCLDNAAMVAGLGYRLHKLGEAYCGRSLEACPGLSFA